MARSTQQSTGALRRAIRFDARLPRPLLLLLILDLLLLVPIPFLLPLARQQESVTPTALALPLPQLTPILGGIGDPPKQMGTIHSTIEPSQAKPLLIDADRLVDAGSTTANDIATLLAQYAPELAQTQVNVGANVMQPVANVLTGQALRWNINPLVMMALIRTQHTTNPTPTLNILRGNQADLNQEIIWAVTYLRQGLLLPITTTFTLADGSQWQTDAPLDQANFALLRLLAQTHTRAELTTLLSDGPDSWLALAKSVMGDPRESRRVHLDDAPFLQTPFNAPVHPVARFDHQLPLVQNDGVMLGNDTAYDLGYDGHNGWDYELPAKTPILAAATGTVMFAGWIDSGCPTPAGVVVLYHGNGYSTSYWHLAQIDVGVGDALKEGVPLGIVGATGCAHGAHLHFGVQRLGRDVDPNGWCQPFADPWAQHPLGSLSRWLWRDQINACTPQVGIAIADDGDPVTAQVIGSAWQTSKTGNFASLHSVSTNQPEQTLIWRPYTPFNGWYRVVAFIPNNVKNAGMIKYQIEHADGTSIVRLDQAVHAGSWAELGDFRFLAGQTAKISLSTNDQERNITLWADAIALQQQPSKK